MLFRDAAENLSEHIASSTHMDESHKTAAIIVFRTALNGPRDDEDRAACRRALYVLSGDEENEGA